MRQGDRGGREGEHYGSLTDFVRIRLAKLARLQRKARDEADRREDKG